MRGTASGTAFGHNADVAAAAKLQGPNQHFKPLGASRLPRDLAGL